MSAPQNFRTSFNGFNREDVVHYLEYINSRHSAQVNQLTSEADYLRRQLEQSQALAASSAEVEALRGQFAALQQELEESLSIRRALEARCNGLQQELEEALAAARTREAAPAVPSSAEQELETYRRAERIERRARERAEQIYHLTNGVLADATAQVDCVADQNGAMADSVAGQLEQLRSAVSSSKQALKNAAQTMGTLRPEEE